MTIRTNPSSPPGLFSPQIMMALKTLFSEFSQLSPQGLPPINMGPRTDTIRPDHNIFRGSTHAHAQWAKHHRPSGSTATYDVGPSGTGASGVSGPDAGPSGAAAPGVSGPDAGASGPAAPATSGPDAGASGPAAPGVSGPDAGPSGPAAPGVSGPDAGASGPAAPATSGPDAGASGSSGAGGSNQGYVDMMMKALKANNAPQDVLDAYMKQYQLLGLTGGGPSSGSSGPVAPSGGPSGASGGPSGPISGGPSGANPPGGVIKEKVPNSGASGASGAGSSGPAAPPSSGTYPTSSADGHPLGKIVVTDPSKYDQTINDAIKKYGGGQKVDPNIIKGMIWQESKGDPLAVGSLDDQGSKGLLQVTSLNATTQGFGNQFDPVQSISLGVKMYADALKNNNGDVTLALGEYNQGPGAKSGGPAQTYAQKVQEWAPTFAKGAGSLPGSYKVGQLE